MKVSLPNSREIPSTCLLASALFQTFLIWYIFCALDNYKTAKNTFKRFPNLQEQTEQDVLYLFISEFENCFFSL